MRQQTERVPVMSATERKLNITKIREWVDAYRQKHNIQEVGRQPLMELSCIFVGEGYNLLMRQLVNTEFPHGNWREIIDDDTGEIIQLVLDEMAHN